MRVVYVDELFLLNFATNFILLLITGKICDVYKRRLRIMLTSVSGGIYAVFASLPDFSFLNSLFMKLTFAALMVFAVFGFHRSYFRLLAVFISVSAALGGIVYAVSLGADGVFSVPGIKALALSFLTASALIAVFFKRIGKSTGTMHKIHITCFGKSADFTAMTDTGCSLKDPVTGQPAIIIGIHSAGSLFPNDLYNLIKTMSPADTLEALSGSRYSDKFRLLPYSTVGISSGMLLAVKADVTIDGVPKPKTLVAISPTDISDGAPYSALVGI